MKNNDNHAESNEDNTNNESYGYKYLCRIPIEDEYDEATQEDPHRIILN